MKRLFLYFLIFVILLFIIYGESRSFYCLDNGHCITVWKTFNNVCYIAPGKYFGILKPSKNFIESTNTNNLTIYFSSLLPNSFVYRSEQSLKINNNDSSKFYFYDYNSDSRKFHSLLYLPNAKKYNDIKENALIVDLIIKENYAIDKDGKKLE